MQDFDRASRSSRAAVQRGDILVSEMQTLQPDGMGIEVPGGAIHHWRGAILIQDVTLNDVLNGVRSPLRFWRQTPIGRRATRVLASVG